MCEGAIGWWCTGQCSERGECSLRLLVTKFRSDVKSTERIMCVQNVWAIGSLE